MFMFITEMLNIAVKSGDSLYVGSVEKDKDKYIVFALCRAHFEN